jgi:hypothetical protein
MTTLSLPPQQPAYVLVEGLRESASVLSIRRAAPDEWAREELLLLRKLGPKGWGRVYQFRNYYGFGWGEKGRVLSPRALDAFFRFVEMAEFSTGTNPSVFLTDRGGIELCWEDHDGNPIQVEFTATEAEFFKGATDEEGTLPLENLAQLSQQLFA